MAKVGGRRPGAGRSRGSANIRTREIADQAALNGVTPLEVLLRAMREAEAAGDLDRAAYFAKDAAPFCHPRLSSIRTTGTVDVTDERPDTRKLAMFMMAALREAKERGQVLDLTPTSD